MQFQISLVYCCQSAVHVVLLNEVFIGCFKENGYTSEEDKHVQDKSETQSIMDLGLKKYFAPAYRIVFPSKLVLIW